MTNSQHFVGKMVMLDLLTLHTGSGYSGYDLAEIEAKWHPKIVALFGEWHRGQTGAVTPDGRFIVYAWDMHRFLHNLPALD